MYEQIPWDDFKSSFKWKQGEHIAAVAPTGAGKTTLLNELIPYRKYNIFFGTKPKDKMYDEIIKTHGFHRVESIHEIKPWHDNVILWPYQRKTIPEMVEAQRAAFKEALDVIVRQGAWTVWVDEAKYLAEFLKLRGELTYCLEQLRSVGSSIITGAQRPAWLPLSALSNATHVFMWKTTLDADAKRLSDIGGVNSKEIMEVAKSLDKHEFLYIKTRGTQAHVVRSQIERGK